jgi:hypothetical protein
VLIAALVLALLLAGCGSGHPNAPADESPWDGLSVGWSRLPPSPTLRARVASVWTGHEVLVWGGDTDLGGTHHADGAEYDPATEEWRALPPSPLSPRSSPGAVWTGTEMLVWGGWSGSGDGTPLGDGAVYDPERRSWRMLPPAPLGPRVPVAAVWTGREVLVWGDASRFTAVVDGAAYDPVADRWRVLPRAPAALNEASAVWTGGQMIVFGALLDGNNWSKTEHARGIAYRPVLNQWHEIAPYPLSPQATWAVWTGEEVAVWDYELRAAAYDPVDDAWRDLPHLPLDFSECYPRSVSLENVIFAWHCGGPAALLDLTSDEWIVVRPPEQVVWGNPLGAGDVVVLVGASHEGRPGGWVYKP